MFVRYVGTSTSCGAPSYLAALAGAAGHVVLDPSSRRRNITVECLLDGAPVHVPLPPMQRDFLDLAACVFVGDSWQVETLRPTTGRGNSRSSCPFVTSARGRRVVLSWKALSRRFPGTRSHLNGCRAPASSPLFGIGRCSREGSIPCAYSPAESIHFSVPMRSSQRDVACCL
jgi:hypothetical protein